MKKRITMGLGLFFCLTHAYAENEVMRFPTKEDFMPPALTVRAPDKIHILSPNYSVEADAFDESGISHVIFNILPDKNFIVAEPPSRITPQYLPPNPGDSFRVYVIASDNFGNMRKDFVVIRRVHAPPELTPSGYAALDSEKPVISVKNLSDREIGEFYTDIYFTDIEPQPGQIGDLRIFVDSPVPPQADTSLEFTNPFHPDPIEEMWVQVDTDDRIAEFDEENNIGRFPP
jgi:hypothetical protein